MRTRTIATTDELAELWELPTVSWRQAASLFGVGQTALKESVRRGDIELPVISIGTRRVIPTAAIRRLLSDEAQG